MSHIAAGQYCGALAGVEGADGSLSHEIMFVLHCREEVALRQCPAFSGMEGSSTWSITLKDYFVGEDELIADPARPFIARIKAAFILLQTGMAVGVTQGSIDSIREVEPALGHVNQHLDERPDALQAELDELRQRALTLAKTPSRAAATSCSRCWTPGCRGRAGAARLPVGAAPPGGQGLSDERGPPAAHSRGALRGHRDAGHQAPALGDGAPDARGDAVMSEERPFQQYICRACGLIYDEAEGDPDSGLAPGTRFEDIPDDWECPLCGVTKADFEPFVPREPVDAVAADASPHRVGAVVVGAGLAGWAAVEALRALDRDLPITLVTACSGDRYHKPELSVALSRGQSADDLVRESGSEAARRLGVQLLPRTFVTGLSPQSRRLRTTRGTLSYTGLVLAMGARPALPAALPEAHCWRVNDLAGWSGLQRALADGQARVAVVGAAWSAASWPRISPGPVIA